MNRNLTGGYYIVSLGDVELLGESVSLPDVAKLLYEAKKHKFVVLQDIVMGGNKKVAIPVSFDASMAYTTEPEDWDEETDGEFVPEPIYTATIYNVYGKIITIDAEGVASVTDYEVQADVESLYGKFVRIMDAPGSTTLTDEQVEIIKEGVFIKGVYLGYKNPILLPMGNAETEGCIIGSNNVTGGVEFKLYAFSGNTIVLRDVVVGMDKIGGIWLGYGKQLISINGKNLPLYPTDQTDKTYVLKLVNGTLTWVEETA